MSRSTIRVRWDGNDWNAVPETTDDEFHRSVAGLYNYPSLAREIGLIWDVDLPLDDKQICRHTSFRER